MGRTLENLPAELLHEVCERLCTHCLEEDTGGTHARVPTTEEADEIRSNRMALASLSRTSTRVSGIARPYLYHLVYYRLGDREESLPLLIRTLISR
jgi:hypothetical protein